MRRQRGFTLIELILVIVMLAILSAFALPRFANLGRDARIASVQGAAASIRSASAIAHATYLTGVAPSGFVAMESTVVSLVGGYPVAHVPTPPFPSLVGIAPAAGISTDSYQIDPLPAASNNGVVTIRPQGVGATANCYVRYTQANTTGSVAPSITLQTGGC